MGSSPILQRGERVVVLGGGVVGLSVARELAGRGVSVVLLEARDVGSGASTAAVGVLSAPTRRRSALARLARAGYETYAELARSLNEETGVDVGYRECGSITLLDGLPASPDRQLSGWSQAGVEAGWRGREDLEDLIPGYDGGARKGLWLRQEAVVYPAGLVSALRLSCELRGVEIHERVGELRLVGRSQRVSLDRPVANGAARFPDGLEGAAVVLAAGAWASRACGELPEPRVAVEPVRGQALELRCPAPRCIVRFAVPFSPKGYFLVPREQRTWVGGTVEDVGFDNRTTEEGKRELLAAAREVLPHIDDGEVASVWSGLRPRACRRGGPFLGPWPGISNLWMACGHYRSGILMGPVSARLLAESMTEGRPLDRDFSLCETSDDSR